jgi:hypothetical protein
VLHERHITTFDGTFAEWEVVSEEREHAAAVRASEEQALRRHEEKKRTARRDQKTKADDPRRALRQSRELAQAAELRVDALEQEIARLTAALDDPTLYTTPGGVDEAHRLGAELDRVRVSLDAAIAEWEQRTVQLESLERAGVD